MLIEWLGHEDAAVSLLPELAFTDEQGCVQASRAVTHEMPVERAPGIAVESVERLDQLFLPPGEAADRKRPHGENRDVGAAPACEDARKSGGEPIREVTG